jgi:hypothetical protein
MRFGSGAGAWNPDLSGRFTSRKTMSNSGCFTTARAAATVSASPTIRMLLVISRRSRITLRTSGSSSTMIPRNLPVFSSGATFSYVGRAMLGKYGAPVSGGGGAVRLVRA